MPKIPLRDLYSGVPVLRNIAKAKLAPNAAMYIAQLLRAVDDAVNFYEGLRLDKLGTLADRDDDGNIKWTEVAGENGAKHQQVVYKSPEAEKEMEDFAEELLSTEIEIPHRIKSWFLNPGPGNTGGYALSPEECARLGGLISYKELAKIKDED